MVRLVFRPYTQVKRTICTSVSLRASTRVSPGFALLRHSSPSFGSQQICSYSNLSQANDRSVVQQNDQSAASSHLGPEQADPSLSLRIGVLDTLILAYMLDSLVRVSRRVNENHFVSILECAGWLDYFHDATAPLAELCSTNSACRRNLGAALGAH